MKKLSNLNIAVSTIVYSLLIYSLCLVLMVLFIKPVLPASIYFIVYYDKKIIFTLLIALYLLVVKICSLLQKKYMMFVKLLAYGSMFLCIFLLFSSGPPRTPDSIKYIMPTVEILSPQSDGVVRGITTIDILARDDIGIEDVAVYIDHKEVFATGRETAQYQWDTASYDDGKHQISVYATNVGGNTERDTIYVIVDNLPLDVTLPDTTPPTPK